MAVASLDPFTRAARLTTEFYAWEERGRGWWVWPNPVELEPPFRPIWFSEAGRSAAFDDGRKPAASSSWLRRVLGLPQPVLIPDESLQEEPEPSGAEPRAITEIQLALGPESKFSTDLAEHFLLSLSSCSTPVGFEVIGTTENVAIQLSCAEADGALVLEQARAHFPEAVCSTTQGRLAERWEAGGPATLALDFGLSNEFMRPLRTLTSFDADPLIAIAGALGDLQSGELAVLQVLFQPVRSPWATQIQKAISGPDGEGLLLDAPELSGQVEDKLSRPLYAAIIRVGIRAREVGRAWQVGRRMGGALSSLADPAGNELIALSNENYPDDEHARDLILRGTRRSGFILNSEELTTLVHPPSGAVRVPRLARTAQRTKAAPKELTGHSFVLGENTHGDAVHMVGLSEQQRLRHTHLIGASGTGKSTLLLNLIVQDMEQGRGLALIDPHGDLVEEVLGRVPERRIDDVILVDPSDVERPIGFNILSAHSDLEKTLLSSDLVAVFRRLSTTWGDQMTSLLSNAVLAFLESRQGGTLADLRRFLIEPEYRKEFLATVKDAEVVYYWQKEFPLLSGRPQAPLLTRLDTFLRPKLVRGMMTQASNRLDFASIMNEGKILLIKLSQGAIGEENAALLGSLFVSKIHQLALSRQSVAESERRPFYVYLDEFQHFVTPSMATLLTGARKYGVGLVLAHQELRQLWNQERDVAGAVLANAATRICFRVGDEDAKKLEDGFATFTARDLQNLAVGQAVCRVERAEWDFSLSTTQLPPVSTATARERRGQIVQLSRARHGAEPATPPPGITATEPAHAAVPRPVVLPEVPAKPPTTWQAPASPQPATPSGPGRGGAQHKYLQELIRRWADAHGWRAVVEQSILDGLGSVDVALENGSLRIAAEISVSSTTDCEVGNIQKCLAAGFDQVVSVVVDKRSRQRLEQALESSIEKAVMERVKVLGPEELFAYLDLAHVPPQASTDKITRGYAVRVTRGKVTAAGQSPAQTVARTLVGALKRMGQR